MKQQLGVLSFLLVCSQFAVAQTAATSAPFVPEPILNGGVVLSIYPADSPRLKRERIHEPERYNTALKNKSDKTLTVLNVHNPSIEVHLAGDEHPNSGAAVIVAPAWAAVTTNANRP